MQAYAKVASQRHTWWATALGGRSGELTRVFNCQQDGPATGSDVFTYCNAHGQTVDLIVISPYTNVPDIKAQTQWNTIFDGLTAAQTCDFADIQNNLANRYQPVWAGWQAAVANQTTVSGHTCRWGAYEGGQYTSAVGGADLSQVRQNFGGRYHPLEYPVTLGLLSLLQSYGCSVFNHYALDQPPILGGPGVQGFFGVYYAHGALAGRGDGSDGLHDNRPDIAGAPPGVVNLLTAVTPIGQAYNDWNGAIVSIPLTSGTASAGSVTPTSISVSVTAATGGTGPYTYQWRRSTTSGSGYVNVAGATSTSLVDTGLTSGTTYFYQCVATDSASATATSNQVSVATPLPVPAVSPASTPA
jgi:hypothetical protein